MVNRSFKKYLRKKFSQDSSLISYIFNELCRYNDWEKARYILNHSIYQYYIKYAFADNSLTRDNPLLVASVYGHLSIIRTLLEHHSSINQFDIQMFNNRVIQLACNNGHLKIVKYLLHSKSINYHAKIDYICLDWAYDRNHNQIVFYILNNFLLENIYKPSEFTERHYTSLKSIQTYILFKKDINNCVFYNTDQKIKFKI